MRILVVEDDRKVARFIQQGLEEEGHAVDVAPDGDAGARLAHVEPYDVLILDVQLPAKNGLALASELRREGVATPILMLTARDTTEDIVRGLDAGADDYLTKPFAFDELVARVRALGRRGATGSPAATLRFADVEADGVHHRATRGGRPLDLTPREFRLLEHFLGRPDAVVTRTELLEKVWDMSFDPGSNVVDVHVSNLRGKLEEGGRARLIQTVRGVGFALREPA
jgi:two-component system copper resistance phosphate regulon response regulator CusR